MAPTVESSPKSGPKSLPFSHICDLLQALDDQVRSSRKEKTASRTIIETWFRHHRTLLEAPEADTEPGTILSLLLPGRRTDRVYGIQVARLERIISRSLALGRSRVQDLARHSTPGCGDLADCVERVLLKAPNPSGAIVTVEEMDGALNSVAAVCRFSSPEVRQANRFEAPVDVNKVLGDLYRRVSPRDGKWLTRLILKNYEPVDVKEWVVLRSYHVLLPQMLKVRDNLAISATFLRTLRQSPDDAAAVAQLLKPVLGTKVGRPTWIKARSIKHCLDMGRSRMFSCEQKMDGEYCQVHINLDRRSDQIQIFSKSGKDSTADRAGLHSAIRESLRLDRTDCRLRAGCILEGELVVYSTRDHKILPFHKIRKHVSRSGSFIGTNKDSQRHSYERLMIVYYDVLMVDNISLLGTKQSDRFRQLQRLVSCRDGVAQLVERKMIDFSRQSAAAELREVFAECIVKRREGLVLKPDDPYFDFGRRPKPYASCVIKLKKEYVQGWGDVGDFAVVGASYDAARARRYMIPNLKWTHFYIACLRNKDAAQARSQKPSLMVTNIVELNDTLLRRLPRYCTPNSVGMEENRSLELDFRLLGNAKRPTVVFPEPMVFDVRCFSFDKESGSRDWTMRFPMVSKIHNDRSYLDTISYQDFQEAAHGTTEEAAMEDGQEMRDWISGLEKADPGGIAVDALSNFSQDDTTDSASEDGASTVVTESPGGSPIVRYHAPIDRLVKEKEADVATKAAAPVTLSRPSVLYAVSSQSPIAQPPGQRKLQKRHSEPLVETWVKRQRALPTDPSRGPSTAGAFTCQISPPKLQRRRTLASSDGNTSAALRRSQSVDQMANDDNKMVAGKGLHHIMSLPPPCHGPVEAVNGPAEATAHRDDGQAMGTTTCKHKGSKCTLADARLLLAPCISNYHWLTHDLLGGHGITIFGTSPETWDHNLSRSPPGPLPSPGASRSSSSSSSSSSMTWKPCARRICLVETKRREATEAFLKRIERAELKRRDGKRQLVTAYDWRLVEDLGMLEAGALRGEEDSVWRKHYVGIA